MKKFKKYLSEDVIQNQFIGVIHLGIANAICQTLKEGNDEIDVAFDVTCSRRFSLSEIKRIVDGCGCDLVNVEKSKNAYVDQQYVNVKYCPIKAPEPHDLLTF